MNHERIAKRITRCLEEKHHQVDVDWRDVLNWVECQDEDELVSNEIDILTDMFLME